MKVPSVINPLLQGLQEARAERINTLVQLLSIGVGKTESALVQKVAPLSQEQRQPLLNSTLDALVKLARVPASTQRDQQLAQLLEQKQLLNSPLLKLVKLLVNGRSLVTYTDRPVEPGQAVNVRLTDANRLVLLADRPNTTSNSQLQSLLAQALRAVLPAQERPALLEVLPQIQALPLPHRQALLSPSLQQALHSVAQQLRSPAQLAQPSTLHTAMKDSGVFFERKLAQTLLQPKATGQTGRLDAQEGSRLRTGDVKGALLHTLQRINTELGQPGTTATSTTTTAKPLTGPALSLLPTTPLELPQFLAQLARRPVAELSSRTLRTQLLVLLHQQTLNSLARVQFQQLQAVSQQQARAEAPQTPQTWTLEIPVRYGQEHHAVQLHIEEDWLWRHKDEDDSEQSAQKTKRWQVLLSFPLPEAGNFYAQLTLTGDDVTAKLWAEQADTLREVKAKVGNLTQQLEDKGIAVTHLECVHGAPPTKLRNLHYSLVDVKT
ncbi:flagellar hook-length control protein FliK [Marinimicrobium sp. ABcell2]|uniref:flagellar hook-length control protein FliK n=1 Tax=Marinimicrobium sp. ABcell2 TaxID=3069751 RepID=UPI0027AF4004|nr:flagellar hook-length control protein FliK [Marinimicrobium sp. ABcell2]MDQ2077850.1 flagellar hook-length control protein FliK [Marinimicrobium sp. ABcell2]